jgi:hypothetical protein
MSKRLQVMMPDDEYGAVEEAARRDGETVSVWVRRALRESRQSRPSKDVARKLWVLHDALSYNGPTGDIDQILEETAQGYLA